MQWLLKKWLITWLANYVGGGLNAFLIGSCSRDNHAVLSNHAEQETMPWNYQATSDVSHFSYH
jgi:formate/nitrite transporter FocA (FNT family)